MAQQIWPFSASSPVALLLLPSAPRALIPSLCLPPRPTPSFSYRAQRLGRDLREASAVLQTSAVYISF